MKYDREVTRTKITAPITSWINFDVIFASALKSPSSSSRCLGQIPSSAERSDGTKPNPEEHDNSSKQFAEDRRKLVLNTRRDANADKFHAGLNIQRLISAVLTKDEKAQALRFSTRFARGKEKDASNAFSGEIRSVSEIERDSNVLLCSSYLIVVAVWTFSRWAGGSYAGLHAVPKSLIRWKVPNITNF